MTKIQCLTCGEILKTNIFSNSIDLGIRMVEHIQEQHPEKFMEYQARFMSLVMSYYLVLEM